MSCVKLVLLVATLMSVWVAGCLDEPPSGVILATNTIGKSITIQVGYNWTSNSEDSRGDDASLVVEANTRAEALKIEQLPPGHGRMHVWAVLDNSTADHYLEDEYNRWSLGEPFYVTVREDEFGFSHVNEPDY